MFNYIIRRLAFIPIVFLALTLMIFSLQMMLSPTQRIAAYAPDPSFLKGGDAQIAALIEKYGLDEPFLIQYRNWIGNIFTGDLGYTPARLVAAPIRNA